MYVGGKKLVKKVMEDGKREREEGCWREVRGRRLARVEVLDLEKKDTSSSREPRKNRRQKIVVMQKGA